MKITGFAFCLVVVGFLVAQPAAASPDRESLLAPWEQLMALQSATERFEATGADTYHLADEALPYSGEQNRPDRKD